MTSRAIVGGLAREVMGTVTDTATVERVAKAIDAALPVSVGISWEETEALARAAIAAMPGPVGHTSSDLGHG